MKNKKGLSIILIFMLIATLVPAAFAFSFATELVTQEEYDEAQKEAEEAQKATDAKRKEAKDAAKAAAAAVANVEEAQEQLEQLSSDIDMKKIEIDNTKAAIGVKQDEIDATQGEIETKKTEMKAKEKEIEDQGDALGDRLTAMYKTGNTGFVDVILNSESIEDLLANAGMVHKILESDQGLLEKLQDDYEELEQMKKDLEAEEADLEVEKAGLEDVKAVLEDQQIELEAKEYETEELKKKYQKEADELHALQAQKEAEAAEMAERARMLQKEAEAMIVESGGQLDLAQGEYAWPTQSNWELSDKYGWRICPFHGREFHNGLDIVLTSGTYGSPVYAIADGYVTCASWYGGYGNCVQYAIGNGYSVLCGHLSGYNCSEGQLVKKGSIIGYIGSTGASTGPHLHFTVFNDGDTINPFSLY